MKPRMRLTTITRGAIVKSRPGHPFFELCKKVMCILLCYGTGNKNLSWQIQALSTQAVAKDPASFETGSTVCSIITLIAELPFLDRAFVVAATGEPSAIISVAMAPMRTATLSSLRWVIMASDPS